MKKLLFCISMLFCLSTIAYAGNDVPLNHQPIGTSHDGNPKAPAAPWYITQDEYVLTMSATPCDYTLSLYDEDDVLVYSVFVPAGTTQVVLPATLSGNFEIRFETATYYYYGYISL
jgi:hypothetical protein